MDDENPLQGGSHASSSHEASLDPTTKRREDLGKHNVHTHFPRDRNCEICKRTKITRAPVQKTQWRSRTSSCKFWWLDNSRSQSPQRQLRISKQSSICSRGAGSSHSMDPGVSVQKQNFTRNPEKLAKVPGTREETKSHLLTIRWNSAKLVKISPGIIARPHHTDRRLMVLRKEQCCRVKEGTSAVLFAIGSKWKLVSRFHGMYYLMGRRPMKRRFGQPFKGPIIPFGSLVEYHPIPAKDQSWIHQFGKNVYLDCSSDTLYAGWIWKGDVLIADLEELETMDASENYSKRLNAKEVIFPKQGEFIFPIADGRIKIPGGDQELRHPLWYGIDQFKERVTFDFHWRIRRVSSTTSRVISGCWWSYERFFGPCQEASYTAITLNPESNFTRRKKNHSLFHSSTLT